MAEIEIVINNFPKSLTTKDFLEEYKNGSAFNTYVGTIDKDWYEVKPVLKPYREDLPFKINALAAVFNFHKNNTVKYTIPDEAVGETLVVRTRRSGFLPFEVTTNVKEGDCLKITPIIIEDS